MEMTARRLNAARATTSDDPRPVHEKLPRACCLPSRSSRARRRAPLAQSAASRSRRSWRGSGSPSISTRRCLSISPSTTRRASRSTLGSYFVKDRPVILTLNYFTCPMLCTLILNGMIDALKEIPWTPGRQFEIVTVSIDPTETPTLARLKKKSYLEAYGRPDAGRRLALPDRRGGEHPRTDRRGRLQVPVGRGRKSSTPTPRRSSS